MRRLAVVAFGLTLAACVDERQLAPETPTIDDARKFYAAEPRYLRPLPHIQIPDDLPNITAETCGACHTEIYEEWRVSTHARALHGDAQFMAELAKSKKDGWDVAWMCVNCHTPIENQLPRLVAKLADGRRERPVYVDNPNHDPKLEEEAITCTTCHIRNGMTVGRYGDKNAPHVVLADPWLLTSEVCTQCHQAEAEFPDVNLACTFNTGMEHQASPQAKEGKTCQSCHMPEVERPLTNLDDQPVRRSRRHWFGGSLIPKHPDFAREIEPLRQHYPDGLAVRWQPLPAFARPGEPLKVAVEYENANAGHLLPTGDPERFLLIDFEVRDRMGTVLASKEERIGAVYEWWPKVKKVSDNRLRPKEKRVLELAVTPSDRGPLSLHVTASKWRISEENMKFHDLGGRYVPSVTFFEETKKLPVRGK